jgi:rubrerythrin
MDQRLKKMTKEELIKHIQEGIKTEESAVIIYSRHLSAIVSRSGLPDSDIAEIKRKLDILIRANQRHKGILETLIQQVQGESINVY